LSVAGTLVVAELALLLRQQLEWRSVLLMLLLLLLRRVSSHWHEHGGEGWADMDARHALIDKMKERAMAIFLYSHTWSKQDA
jgi:hypothetical protein